MCSIIYVLVSICVFYALALVINTFIAAFLSMKHIILHAHITFITYILISLIIFMVVIFFSFHTVPSILELSVFLIGQSVASHLFCKNMREHVPIFSSNSMSIFITWFCFFVVFLNLQEQLLSPQTKYVSRREKYVPIAGIDYDNVPVGSTHTNITLIPVFKRDIPEYIDTNPRMDFVLTTLILAAWITVLCFISPNTTAVVPLRYIFSICIVVLWTFLGHREFFRIPLLFSVFVLPFVGFGVIKEWLEDERLTHRVKR